MRVTHVITRLIIGGAQENTVDSVLGLRTRHGHDVDLISGPTRGPEGSLEASFVQTPGALQLAPHLVRPVHPVSDLIALHELTRLIQRGRPELVHTHSGKAGILGRLAAHRAGVPLIVHTIHGPSFGAFQNAAANWLFRSAEQGVAPYTTHFVTVAHAMTRQYLAAGIGEPGRFTRILSGFVLSPFLQAARNPELRAHYGLAPEDFVVAKIARLAPLKGHEDLIAAVVALGHTLPHLRCLLIGDGPERIHLAAAVRAKGLSGRFVFTGHVPPAAIAPLLGAADAIVHLSRREGLPRALTQALAAARPVIAYDCDGASEVCLDNQTGFLIQPGDISALAQRLTQLAQDPALRQRLGQCGRELVKDEFSVERMVDELHALYLRLQAARGQGNARINPS